MMKRRGGAYGTEGTECGGCDEDGGADIGLDMDVDMDCCSHFFCSEHGLLRRKFKASSSSLEEMLTLLLSVSEKGWVVRWLREPAHVVTAMLGRTVKTWEGDDDFNLYIFAFYF